MQGGIVRNEDMLRRVNFRNVTGNDVQVIVLARGKGERLRPLTLNRPKALCPICNSSMLNRLLAQISVAGFRSVTLSLPSSLPTEEWASARRGFPRNLEVIERLALKPAIGSLDAVRQCLDSSRSRVLVVYGDSFLKADLARLLRNHHRWHLNDRAVATVLYHRPDDRHVPGEDGRTYHGIMSCEKSGRVIRFEEKPLASDVKPGFDLANAAVFIVERSIFRDPLFRDAADFSRHFFEPAINGGARVVYGLDIGRSGYRHDLGGLQRFFDGNMNVLSGQWKAPIPGRQIFAGVWCESGVKRSGATLIAPVAIARGVSLLPGCIVGPMAVLGDSCTIGENARVSHSVVMGGTYLGPGAEVLDSVVGAHTRIGAGVRVPRYSFIGDNAAVGFVPSNS
jgi:NDP-sugar pyrophosphorylase family protein